MFWLTSILLIKCHVYHGYYVHEPFNQSAAVKYGGLKHRMFIMYLVENIGSDTSSVIVYGM